MVNFLLREKIKARGNIYVFANKIGLSNVRVSEILNGIRPAKAHEKKLIADGLGLSLYEVFPAQESTEVR